jgi:hypothetical protein
VHEVFNFKEVPSTPVLGRGQVWFAFNFRSDNVVEYEGTYVDNFRLHRSPSPNGQVVPGSPANPPPAPPTVAVATGRAAAAARE